MIILVPRKHGLKFML